MMPPMQSYLYSLSSYSRHVLTIACSRYPLPRHPPRLHCRSRPGQGRDVYEYDSKVTKKNGVEEGQEGAAG